MRYLRMQRSLRLKRRPQRTPDPQQEGPRVTTPERDVEAPAHPRRQGDHNSHH